MNIIQLLLLAAQAAASGTQPTISNLALTPHAGACNTSTRTVATQASVSAAWSVTGANDASYTTQVSVNSGAPVVLGSTSTTAYTVQIPGRVENDSGRQSPITTTVEVRIVRTADSVVVQNLTASYTGNYGDCSGVV